MSAEVLEFRSATTQVSLLELYTSEGCSSCPPAETWLSQLKANPKLWKDFVPVAFHVDYWDYLGWTDPFSSKANSDRQRTYASQWRSRSVYTPGFVLDGKEWRNWSDSDGPPRAVNTPLGVLTARSQDGRQWTLRFEPTSGKEPASSELHAVLLGFDLISDVKSGENRGRKLQHDFVVLAQADAKSQPDGPAAQAEVTLRSKLTSNPKRLGFAAWITANDQARPLQAVGGWLATTNLAR